MAHQASGKRLAAILWFVAAGLALLAAGLGFARGRDMNWGVAAAGLFCLLMGLSAWSRSGQSPPR